MTLNAASLESVVAQLRHAYSLLMNGHLGNHQEFARGLIAPQIRHLEQLLRESTTAPVAVDPVPAGVVTPGPRAPEVIANRGDDFGGGDVQDGGSWS